MTRKDAQQFAQETADENNITLALMAESYHADEFAERDTDGESYGFCPIPAIPILYKYGTQVATITPTTPEASIK